MPYDAIFAPAPSTTRGQSTVIAVDEKGGNLLYGSGRSVVIRSIADPLKASSSPSTPRTSQSPSARRLACTSRRATLAA